MNLILIHRASTKHLLCHKLELEEAVVAAAESNSIYTKMLNTQLGLVYSELRKRGQLDDSRRSQEEEVDRRRAAS